MNETPRNVPTAVKFSDKTTTISDLKRLVAAFVEERDWARFHTPKNLAASVSIEAAELLEHFQWLTPEESFATKDDAAKKQAIAEEISDVLSYLLNLGDRLEIDVAAAFEEKMRQNARKYPKETFRGVYGADDPNLNASNEPTR